MCLYIVLGEVGVLHVGFDSSKKPPDNRIHKFVAEFKFEGTQHGIYRQECDKYYNDLSATQKKYFQGVSKDIRYCFIFFSQQYKQSLINTLKSDQYCKSLDFNERIQFLPPMEKPQSITPETAFGEKVGESSSSDIKDGCSKQDHVPWGLHKVASYKSTSSSDDIDNLVFKPEGKNIAIYILDSGFDNTWRTKDEEFKGRVEQGVDFTSGYEKPLTEGDGSGHGTHCAGTAAGLTFGVCKKCTIVPVQVVRADGFGSWGMLLDGMEWAQLDCHKKLEGSFTGCVISISLSSEGKQDAALDMINHISVGQDADSSDGLPEYAPIPVVVAAGNADSDACGYSPAAAKHAITVGATNHNNARASFSNWGSCVDIWAPGENIKSAYPNGAEASISGTSMACPIVAGIIGTMLSNYPGITPKQIREILHYDPDFHHVGVTITDLKGSVNLFAKWPGSCDNLCSGSICGSCKKCALNPDGGDKCIADSAQNRNKCAVMQKGIFGGHCVDGECIGLALSGPFAEPPTTDQVHVGRNQCTGSFSDGECVCTTNHCLDLSACTRVCKQMLTCQSVIFTAFGSGNRRCTFLQSADVGKNCKPKEEHCCDPETQECVYIVEAGQDIHRQAFQVQAFQPPKGCNCISVTRTDGYLMPNHCASSPTNNAIRNVVICYVDNPDSCSESIKSAKSSYDFVVCTNSRLDICEGCVEGCMYRGTCRNKLTGFPRANKNGCEGAGGKWCAMCHNKYEGDPTDCDYWKDEGYCESSSEYYDYMMEECECGCSAIESESSVSDSRLGMLYGNGGTHKWFKRGASDSHSKKGKQELVGVRPHAHQAQSRSLELKLAHAFKRTEKKLVHRLFQLRQLKREESKLGHRLVQLHRFKRAMKAKNI